MFNHFQPSNYDLAIHRNVNCSTHKSTTSSSSQPKKRMRAAESRRCRIESPTGLAPAPTHACICLQAGQSHGSPPPPGTALGPGAPAMYSFSNLLQTCGVCAVHPHQLQPPLQPRGSAEPSAPAVARTCNGIFSVWSEGKQKEKTDPQSAPRARGGRGV